MLVAYYWFSVILQCSSLRTVLSRKSHLISNYSRTGCFKCF